MELLFQLAVFVTLLVIGLVFGRASERRHFRQLQEREAQLRDVLVFAERTPPPDREFREAALVVGSVVIAEDYFKRIAAALRGLVGGRVTVYESLMDRGRREAILRMKEEARRRGATLVFNVRFETSSLSEDAGGRSPMFSAEFIAYGTALVPR
ncbi:MAG: heavy metal-binding domain-containing protein [Steroidobacteraceae bacterium]